MGEEEFVIARREFLKGSFSVLVGSIFLPDVASAFSEIQSRVESGQNWKAVFVTDLGNTLMYGVGPLEIPEGAEITVQFKLIATEKITIRDVLVSPMGKVRYLTDKPVREDFQFPRSMRETPRVGSSFPMNLGPKDQLNLTYRMQLR